MEKIFTEDHEKRLKELFLELGFSGETITGKFGANHYNVTNLLHDVSLSTLKEVHVDLKKSVAAIEEQDEWSLNAYQKQKADRLKKWKEYVNLLVGYRLHLVKIAEQREKERKEKQKKLAILAAAKEMKEIKEIEELSIEELDKKIAELS